MAYHCCLYKCNCTSVLTLNLCCSRSFVYVVDMANIGELQQPLTAVVTTHVAVGRCLFILLVMSKLIADLAYSINVTM